MQLEYFAYEPLITNEEYQESIFWAVENNFDIVSIPLSNLIKLKEFIIGPKIAVAIDFPFGNAIPSLKLHSIIEAGRKGAHIVDVVLNNNLIINDNENEIAKEIGTYIHVCNTNKLDLRIILDYTVFDDEKLSRVCYLIAKAGINTIITNTGRFVDNISDNLIVCKKIKKSLGLRCVLTTHHLSKESFNIVKASGIDGVRFLSMNSAKHILS